MKIILEILIALIAIVAVVLQFYISINTKANSFAETSIRFFSYYTILTNLIVGIYFLNKCLNVQSAFLNKAGTLTAITGYITVVGLIYQTILRYTWNPEGLQMIVDESLHSVTPVLTILYWILYGRKNKHSYSELPGWLLYPLGYLIFVLIRGHFSGFYPYPFVDVSILGFSKVLLNSFWIFLLFVFLFLVFITISRLSGVNVKKPLNRK